MTKEEARALLRKCGGNKSMAARQAGVPRRTFGRILARGSVRHSVSSFPIHVRSLSDFKQSYDKETIIPRAVQGAFKQLGSGWLYEAEFAKLACISMKDISMFRDRYAAHIVIVADHRRIWVGNPRIAEEMRRMI